MTASNPLLWRLLMRLTVYYGGLLVLVAAAMVWWPQGFEALPLGGVTDMAGDSVVQRDLEDALLNGDEEDVERLAVSFGSGSDRLQDAKALLFAMAGSLLIMIPVAWVYRAIHIQTEHDRSLDETVMLLPLVVAGIVTVVQHSLALAFSLAGIVAGVRFRRSLNDTFDTLFVFVAIGVGIAAGIKALGVAFIIAVFFCFAATFVGLAGDGLESQYRLQRKLEKQQRKRTTPPENEAAAPHHE